MVERQVVALKVVGSIPIIYHMLFFYKKSHFIKKNNFITNPLKILKSKNIKIDNIILLIKILNFKFLNINFYFNIYFLLSKINNRLLLNLNNIFLLNLKRLKLIISFNKNDIGIINAQPGMVNKKPNFKKLKKT